MKAQQLTKSPTLSLFWQLRMKNLEYEADQELEEEGGDANDGQHEEVGDQEGASSILQTMMMMVMMMAMMMMMISVQWI